jgi:DNA-binding PadR family transcriptional regulator
VVTSNSSHPAARPGIDYGSPVITGLIRGMLPFALMKLIAERPRHGSELIRSISDMTGGAWTPSPGSVYPVLRKLEQEGHVRGEWERTQSAPKRIYQLTDKGRQALPDLRHRLVAQLTTARHLIDDHLTVLTQDPEAGGHEHQGKAVED